MAWREPAPIRGTGSPRAPEEREDDMPRHRRRSAHLPVALLAAAALLLVSCGGDDSGGGGSSSSSASPSRPVAVDVGTLPISNAAPMYLGMRKGFFKAEGLEPQPHVAQNGAELITGALSGSFDFIFAGYIPSIV